MHSSKSGVCVECVKDTKGNPPCSVKKKPKRAQFYTFDGSLYQCVNQSPLLDHLSEPFVTSYRLSASARDGMSGVLDYGVLLKVAEANGITGENINILMSCVNDAESKAREKDKPLQIDN